MFASYLRDHRAVRTMIYVVFAQRFSVIVDVHMGYPKPPPAGAARPWC